MKKYIFLFICILMIFPIIVNAHTSLSSSNPSEGQVVTEDLDKILVNFATTIEKLSTMKLVKDGSTIPLKAVKVENKQLIGEISKPLENGSYTIQWNIIGEDGHPIKGEINFQIQKESTTDQPKENQTNNEATHQSPQKDQANNEANNQTSNNDQKMDEPKKTSDVADATEEEKAATTSNNGLITVFIGLFALFVIGLIVFFFKKR